MFPPYDRYRFGNSNYSIKLKKIPAGYYLELLSFKKDRSITIIKQTEDSFRIIEKGFHDNLFNVKANQTKKILK